MQVDGDKVWRWVLRIAGLVGLYLGATADPPYPQIVFLILAAMIGLDQFIKRNGKNGK